MTTPLPSLPTAPNRSMPQGVFSPAMDAFLAALLSFRDGLEANRPDIDQAIADAAQVAVDLAAAQAARSAAEAAAMTAVSAPGTMATTTSSVTPGSGAKTFTLQQAGKLFDEGMWVMVASAAAPTTNWIYGQISSFTDPAVAKSMTIQVPTGYFLGAAFSDGIVTIAPPPGSANVPTSRQVTGAGLLAGQGGALSADRTFSLAASTATDLWTGASSTTVPTPAALVAAAAEQTVAYAASVALNMNAGDDWVITGIAGSALTLANPTNVTQGQSGWIRLPHDAAATLAVGSAWKRDGGLPNLTPQAGVTDWIWYVAVSTTQINYRIERNPG